MSHGRHQRLGSHRHQEADQAGIKGGPNGDSVMLVGFSQGGILAGHLAAYRSDDDNFGAVVVCGAPIDNMPIPDRARVISVQHEGDPVPKLDFFTLPPTRPNWQTITSAAPGNPTDVTKIHDAGQYARGEQLHRNGVLLMAGMRRGWTVAAAVAAAVVLCTACSP